MSNQPLNIMLIAAELKQTIIQKGVSIPTFIEESAYDFESLSKEHYNYIVGQGKKMLLAMKGGKK